MTDKKTKPDFNADFFNLLHAVTNPYKSGTNPHFKSKFADLPTCLKTVKPVLKEHNFALHQVVKQSDKGEGTVLQTNLMHISGNVIKDGGIPLVSKDSNDPQKLGGSITYARRYGMCAILGIVGDDDDDANKASEPDLKGIDRLFREYEANIEECADVQMVKDINNSFSDEIKPLDDKQIARFRAVYTKKINSFKKENKNADS